MLAAHAHSPSLRSPNTRRSHSCSRPALADSTNADARAYPCHPVRPKRFTYPTSSARPSCGWDDIAPCVGSGSTLSHPRLHHLSTPSPFPVTYKAPPTVCISLSEACSQSVPGGRCCGSRVQGLEPDLPDVKSVVPFPSTPLDGDMDVDMFDGTCVSFPDGQLRAPRKRRSAHSSIPSQSSVGKDVKQKRPRRSRRQVVELWWLGVVHRSILRCIEGRQSTVRLDPPDRSLCDVDAMDHVLVERIQKRLAENGCVEGRVFPNPLPRISSPSISVPSLNLLAPNRKTKTPPIDLASPALSSESSSKENDGITASLQTSTSSSCLSLSVPSRSLIPFSPPTSHRRHVRFEVLQPRPSLSHPNIPRRSPSPPARTGTVFTNPQTLILTMPQLVASLTLAHRERSSFRLRGRSYKVTDVGKNAGRSLLSVPSRTEQRSDGGASPKEERTCPSFALRARLVCAPERRSPLSHVAHAES